MSKQKLKYLPQEIRKAPAFKEAKIFHHEEDQWIELDSREIADPELFTMLRKAGTNDRYIKLKESARIAFFLDHRQLVVVIKLPPKTRTSTITRYLNRLDEYLSTATSSYDAHYDELTGVLNRHGIKHALSRAYHAVRAGTNVTDEADQQLSNRADISLFAFDIDKFKSVNDTFGHEAGDAVLRAFAVRLSNLVNTLQKGASTTFIFGRPGGEEFEIICVGAMSRVDRDEFGQRLLEEIRKPILYEQGRATQKSGKKSEPSPSNAPRRPSHITSSIGLAWSKQTEVENAEKVLSDLRKEADAALYRAKADGRNCLRVYNDIRRYHGRVLEYHAHSDLVQIDIGSNVGVRTGQTYTVYYPPFTGSQQMRTSGSGEKILGDYPKIPAAKIQVVSVGAEVATAIVFERVAKIDIPVGALLNFLPKGSTIVPHGRSLSYIALTSPLSKLYDEITRLNGKNQLEAIMAFGWSLDEEFTSRSTKQAEFYMLLRCHLPSSSTIFYSSGNPIFVTIPRSGSEQTGDLKDLIEVLKANLLESGISLSIGVSQLKNLPPGASREPDALAFYARSALTCTRYAPSLVVFFDKNTPRLTMENWKKLREGDEAVVDYQKFRQYGFDYARLNNQLGLAIMESEATEHFPLAEAAFLRAASAELDKSLFTSNLGLLQTLRGKYEKAYQSFEKAEKDVKSKGGIALVAFAKCGLELRKSENQVPSSKLADLLLRAAEAFTTSPRSPYDRLWKDVKNALKTGDFG